MKNMNKKKLIYFVIIAYLILVAIVMIFVFKPWKSKPKSVKAVKVGDMSAYTPVLSDDGRDIYYYDATELNLFKYNLSSKKKTQLSNNMSDAPDVFNWSPDHSNVIIRIVYDKTKFAAEKSIFVNSNIQDGATTLWDYNLDNQKVTLLNDDITGSNSSPDATNPIWAADSKKIIYYENNVSTNQYALNMSNPNGTDKQILGKVPDDIFSILSYDSNHKIIYYSIQANNETGIGQIFKFNLATNQKDSLFDGTVTSSAIDDHQFIVSNENKSIIYNATDNSQKTLPILVSPERTSINPDKTSLVADIIASNREQFYIIDLVKLSISKKLDPGLNDTGYINLSLDLSGNIFFVNKNNLFEIKN